MNKDETLELAQLEAFPALTGARNPHIQHPVQLSGPRRNIFLIGFSLNGRLRAGFPALRPSKGRQNANPFIHELGTCVTICDSGRECFQIEDVSQLREA